MPGKFSAQVPGTKQSLRREVLYILTSHDHSGASVLNYATYYASGPQEGLQVREQWESQTVGNSPSRSGNEVLQALGGKHVSLSQRDMGKGSRKCSLKR